MYISKKLISIVSLALAFIIFPVQAQDATESREFVGFVSYKDNVGIYSLIDGTIISVEANVGDTVQKGQTLIQFDTSLYEAQVTIAESQIDQLKIKLDDVNSKFEREQELFDRGSLSLLAYEATENELKNLKAKLTNLNAELAIADYWLAQTTLVSPIDGVVTELSVVPGFNVNNRVLPVPLMTVVSSNEYSVFVDVPFEKRTSLKLGDNVTVSVNDHRFTGEIRKILRIGYGASDGDMRPYTIRVNFQTTGEMILPGTPSTVTIN